jgi:hypothetical protein
VDDAKLHPCVRVAAARGRAMLNKYYGLSDDSNMYRIAMHKLLIIFTLQLRPQLIFSVLHPKYRSAYFMKAGWPLDWIKTAEDLLRSQWRDYYRPSSIETNVVPVSDGMLTLDSASC